MKCSASLSIARETWSNYESFRRYQVRRPDLADLCLIRLSELYPLHVVITVDEGDFRVYRRNKREVIPILSPPRA